MRGAKIVHEMNVLGTRENDIIAENGMLRIHRALCVCVLSASILRYLQFYVIADIVDDAVTVGDDTRFSSNGIQL